MRARRFISLLAIPALAACGYSEDEWQAQLAKYEALRKQHDAEKGAHGKTRADLEKTREELERAEERVGELIAELKKMGVDVAALEQKLEAEGKEKSQLQRALEEYKRRADVLERIKARFEQLRDKLKKLTEMGLKVSIRNNRMVISLPGDVLFDSGSDKLRKEGFDVLKAVADVVRSDTQLAARYFQIAGHTDDRPLKGGPYKDNWGLSAMRARGVLIWLTSPPESKDGGGGLDQRKLHAAGYGDTDPVADNGSDEGRTSNRRVELVLMPDVEEMLDLRKLSE